MNQQLPLDEYKQQVANFFNGRGQTYDQSNWHLQIAQRLVEYAKPSSGQKILDIATGTGMAAIAAAQLVGDEGRVVGVDISQEMLESAKRKVQELGLSNIEFLLADGETLDFPAHSFDLVLCSSALIWLADIPAALRLWYKFLKPNGLIGFHAFAETAMVGGVVARQVLKRYGVQLAMNQPTGTIEKCYQLLESGGFEAIAIHTQQDGSYISLAEAKKMWSVNSHLTPGQFPSPLAHLSSEQLQQIQLECETEIAALETEQGVWNDITIFYCLARKPARE